MPLRFLLVACLHMDLCNGADELDHIHHGTRLLNHLLDPTRYNKMLIPRSDDTSNVTVVLGLQPINLIEMNEKSGFMSFMFWKLMRWTDIRLRWNETEYGGVQSLRIPMQSIWSPDVTPYNRARPGQTDGLTESNQAAVYSDGTISYLGEVLYETSCVFDMHHFPFDVQTCNVEIGSWTYSGDVVDLKTAGAEVGLSHMKSNQNHAWRLEEATVVRNVKKFECCTEKYIDLLYTFRLRRRSNFFRDLYVIPAVLVAMLVPFVFALPVTRIHRYILGGVLLLVFTQLSMAFDSNTPTTDGGTPLIAQLFTCLQALVAISLLLSAILTNLANKGAGYITPPRLIQKIIIDVLGRILYISKDQTSTPMVTDGDDNDDSSGTVTSTWLIMAQVLDRLFFLVYGVAFVIMAIAFAAVGL